MAKVETKAQGTVNGFKKQDLCLNLKDKLSLLNLKKNVLWLF